MNDLAAQARLTQVEYDPFQSEELARAVPTTEAQREVWLADQLSRDASLAYNESVTLSLKGQIDVSALQNALLSLTDRHEALRSTLSEDGVDMLIAPRGTLQANVVDLHDLGADARGATLARLKVEAVETPFDLQRGPLVRATLVKLGRDSHELLLTAHHIVCDGWSFGVLAKDLASLYEPAASHQAKAALPLVDSFGDYALALLEEENIQSAQTDNGYWVGLYDGSVPVLELPTDRPRAPLRSFRSRRIDVRLDVSQVDAVRKLGTRNGASLFVTLFAMFSGLMGRLAGSGDVVVGVPAAGQSAHGKDQLVGHCVHLLPIRASVDTEQSVAGLIGTSRGRVLDAYEHQSATFGSILKKLQVERDSSRLPLVSVLFNLDSAIAGKDIAMPGLEVELRSNPRHFENFDIFLNASQTDGSIELECQFNTDLFDTPTVERWLDLYRVALQRACSDDGRSVAEVFAPTDDDMALLREFNRTAIALPTGVRVEAMIARQAASTPDAVAIRCGDRQLSYRELDRRADALASALRSRGVGAGRLVGLCCGRNEHMLVGLVGILKSGAGYVPLDPAFPTDRLEYMARDAALAHVVSDRSVTDEWKFGSIERIDVDSIAAATIVVQPSGTAEDIAYVIYTSGSTGRPKGVCVPHRSVVNLLESVAREPGMTARDRVLSVTTLSFDIAVSEAILPLTVGATIIVADRAQAVQGDRLRELIESQAVSFIDATPSTWRLLLAAGWTGSKALKAICTGEPLPPDLARELLPLVGELWNGYGPTETTVWSSFQRIHDASGPVPIGRPIANTQIHVVDGKLRLVPVGVIGELYIGGAGVTLGYHGRADLTAERFLPDPFATSPGTRWYRTGDLGRWRADGVLECLGRNDHQVKVRGYRIELGEIEANLLKHPSVSRAVVVTREDQPGDVRIAAYVVAATGVPFDAAALERHLATSLPGYMMPRHFVSLPAIPQLPNGKVERRALPAPNQLGARGVTVSPRTPTEAAVAHAMRSTLGLHSVSVTDDFFQLGGHSLLASRLAIRLRELAGGPVPMLTVFEAPTVERLATWIDQRAKSEGDVLPAISARPDQTVAPASLMQQRLWFLEQLSPGRVTYNTPSAFRLKGALDLPSLEHAFNEMVRRQPILRSHFCEEGGELVQRVAPVLQLSIGIEEDLSNLALPLRETRLTECLQALADKPMDLHQCPLFVVSLFRLSEEEHVLFFMPHHIIWDGWSFDLFQEEMRTLYSAYSTGTSPDLPEPTVSYGDFACWHHEWLRGPELERQVSHWEKRLALLPEPLEVPSDRQRPERMTGSGDTRWVRLPTDLVERARELGLRSGATLFMTLLAGYVALLCRLTGQDDIVVGTPVRGRSHAEVEKLMGFFVNALPLRFKVDLQWGFGELLARVRSVVVNAFSAPDVPFEHLVRKLNVERNESISPVYQTFFSFQDGRQRPDRWANLELEQVFLFQRGAAEDLGLWFLEKRDGLIGGLTYNTDILDDKSATAIASQYELLLRGALDEPGSPVAELKLLNDADRAQLARWNDTHQTRASETTLQGMLEAAVFAAPNAIAVRHDGKTLTYTALAQKVDVMRAAISARGVGRGERVGLHLPRSTDMVVAVLAVLACGAVYVPLDPLYPVDRLRYIAEDADLALVLSHSTSGAGPWPNERVLLVDEGLTPELAGAHVASPPKMDGEDPAYVLYTSGSTGRPKGVVIPHRAIINFLLSMAREPGLSQGDVLVAVTTLSFDISVLELLLPLTVGAQVVVASSETAADGRALKGLLESGKATVMQATPATWRMVIDAGWKGGAEFKALVGGEALSADLAVELLSRCGEVWNMYGPTETTVWSTCWRVRKPDEGIFIGRPVGNTQVHVLDANLQPCPIGVPGELFISGDGVALGYLNRPDLTAERFMARGDRPHALYRTGDRGRYRRDGLLEHLGRLDSQIKIRGFRVEPGEIESRLTTFPGVRSALVAAREFQANDTRLVAYVICDETMPDVADLREHLSRSLPGYMVPQHFARIEAFPLQPNGKLDRRALPIPESERSKGPGLLPHLLDAKRGVRRSGVA